MQERAEACASESSAWFKTAEHLVCSQGKGKGDVSAKHHGVGIGEEMWSVLVGQTENGDS